MTDYDNPPLLKNMKGTIYANQKVPISETITTTDTHIQFDMKHKSLLELQLM